jgi:NADH-quinone oxidoreductase subunit H
VAAQSTGSFAVPFTDLTVPFPGWFVFTLPVSFVIYVIAITGETNRAPFDLPRGRSRARRRLPHRVQLAEVRDVLPRGVHQHGHRLGAGGDAVPRRLAADLAVLAGRVDERGLLPAHLVPVKTFVFIFVFVWLRGVLPRMRYDTFMRFGWKVLVPVGLLWILLVAAIRTATLEIDDRRTLLLGRLRVFAVVLASSG